MKRHQIFSCIPIRENYEFHCGGKKNLLCMLSSSLDEFSFWVGIHCVEGNYVLLLGCVFVRANDVTKWDFFLSLFVPAGNSLSSSVWCLLVWQRCNHRGFFFFLSFLRDAFLIAEALVVSWKRLYCILQPSNLSSNHKVSGSCHWLLTESDITSEDA